MQIRALNIFILGYFLAYCIVVTVYWECSILCKTILFIINAVLSNESSHNHKDFLFFFIFVYVIQHCFICRSSDYSVSEDSGIEARTVAPLALTYAQTTRLDLNNDPGKFKNR